MKPVRKLQFEISEEQYYTWRQYVEHGLQRKLLSIVLDDMLEMLKEHGQLFIIAMLDRQITYRGYMTDYAHRRSAYSEYSLPLHRGPDEAHSTDARAEESPTGKPHKE